MLNWCALWPGHSMTWDWVDWTIYNLCLSVHVSLVGEALYIEENLTKFRILQKNYTLLVLRNILNDNICIYRILNIFNIYISMPQLVPAQPLLNHIPSQLLINNSLGWAEPHSRFPLRYPLNSPTDSVQSPQSMSLPNDVVFRCDSISCS